MQSNNQAVRGWLLDAYPSDFGKMTVWLISESGKRIKLTDNFQTCIYVSAMQDDLNGLITKLCSNQKIASIRFVYKYASPVDTEKSRVLEITLKDCRQIKALELEILRMGDYLRYEVHNCDIQPDRSYLFSHDLFPLAYLEVKTSKTGLVYTLLDSVESIDYVLPKLRVIRLEVDVAKTGALPQFDDEIEQIRLKQEGADDLVIDYGDEATKLLQLVYAIQELDPDIVLTSLGDSFLFPYIIHRAKANNVVDEFNLNRDNMAVEQKPKIGRTYFSYGHTFYRAGTVRLYGRIHVDDNNTFVVREAGLDGLIEVARTCRVPLHTSARFSIGSSMSSMQFYQAQKDDILLPRNKKIAETFKSATDLLIGDRGGFIFEPHLGIHDCVGELDFSSMYPSIMKKYNISAETVLCKCCPDSPNRIPDLNYHICTKRVGMVPKTVDLALTKRLKYKQLRDEADNVCLKQVYDRRQTALKWILVTCFGYLGFSNSKFGTVDGHIGVCAFAREEFLRTVHIAENYGFKVIHGIVDSFWLSKQSATVAEYKDVCREITEKIGIPVNFEGYYKWIVFLPSVQHANVSVLNRYFGVVDNGKVKVRGLDVRKSDTPKFVYDAQVEMIKILSQAGNAREFDRKIPDALRAVKSYRRKLLCGEVPLSDLVVTKHLSKEPCQYKQRVSQLIAARQLQRVGVAVNGGNGISFLFTDSGNKRCHRRVRAEQLLEGGVAPDVKKYLGLLYASAANLLSFRGCTAKTVSDFVNGYASTDLTMFLEP